MQLLDVPYFKQDTTYTCGPTSLQMVFAYFGIRTAEAAVAREVAATANVGTIHQQMIDAVRRRGLHCYVNDNATLNELQFLHSLRLPVIVRFLESEKEEDHYGVVVGCSENEIVLNDPWHGEHVMLTHDEFTPRWTCDILGDCKQWLMAVSAVALPLGRQYHPYD